MKKTRRADAETRPNVLSRRTALAAAGSTLSAAMAGCLGLGSIGGTDLPAAFSRQWQGSTQTDYGHNHHDFAVVEGDEPIIVAPHSSQTGSQDCGFHATDAAGTDAWRGEVDPEFCTPHAVGDVGVGTRNGTTEVFGGTEAGELRGFVAETGEETLRLDILGSMGYSAPIVAVFTGNEPEVIVADFQGGVFAVDTDSTVIWEHDFDGQISASPLCAPLVDDSEPQLAVAHGRRSDAAVSVRDASGESVWSTGVDGITRSRMTTARDDGGHDLIVGAGSSAHRLAGATGERQWTESFDETVYLGAIVDGSVIVGSNDGYIRSLDVADGSTVWEAQVVSGDETRLTAPAVGELHGDGERQIVATTYDETVVALDTAGGLLARYDLGVPSYVSPQCVDLTGDGAEAVVVMDGTGRLTALGFDSSE